MNKEQFLNTLYAQLQVIPAKERNELMEDYVSHFEFGLQEGKTEEELAQELGSPEEIAIEAIAEYERTNGKNSNVNEEVNVQKPNARPAKIERTIFSIIGLFLLNFVCAVIPLIISIWAVWLSLILSFASGILAPLLAVVDFVINESFSSGKLFLSLIMSGVSIFLLVGTWFVGKYMLKLTVAYYKWNVRIIKGAE